jgi:energy-coupling factor transporter ATP-binding protein EcfA2
MDLLAISHLRDRSLSPLSGGEKQRVAVASIIAGRPDVLVLDEPTASLDPEASRDLFISLNELCRRAGLTVVIIEHKLAQLLPLEPRLVFLEQGRVKEDISGNAIERSRVRELTGPVFLQDEVPAAAPPGVDEPAANPSDNPPATPPGARPMAVMGAYVSTCGPRRRSWAGRVS